MKELTETNPHKDSHVKTIIRTFEGIDHGDDASRSRAVTPPALDDPQFALTTCQSQVRDNSLDPTLVHNDSQDPPGHEDFSPHLILITSPTPAMVKSKTLVDDDNVLY